MTITRDYEDYTLLVYDKNLPYEIGGKVLVTFCDAIGNDEENIWLTVIKNNAGIDADDAPYYFDDDCIKESRRK